MSYPLPDGPSIAVLPFANLSEDASQEYFSDGITEQIITSLSNTPYLYVIARNSTFAYKGKAVKVQQVAEELGVRYVLEGSVQRSKNRLRINAQLIDAVAGHHLWAEHFDREMGDVFDIQDQIAMKIMASLQVRLTVADFGQYSAIKTKSLKAYEKLLQSRAALSKRTEGDILLSRKLAQEALSLDPEYGAAYIQLAYTHLDDVWFYRTKSRTESLKAAEQLGKQAVSYSGEGTDTHRLFSIIHLLRRQYDEAVAEGRKAIERSPNSATTLFMFGMVLRFAGYYEEAIPILERAIRLNPITTVNYLNNLAWANAYSMRYGKAIALWNRAIEKNPDYLFAYLGLAASYQLSGNEVKAKECVEQLMRIKPELSLARIKKGFFTKNESDRERMLHALRLAGVPEESIPEKKEKASIAVLPFNNMSDDPEQDDFADGISEDLITDLSKLSNLLVISRMSSFSYKGKNLKVQQIAEELGVRYVLEGSVRKAENRVRINAQLIDAMSGHHLWADRYDGDMSDIFALQDKITRKIISALALKLTASEQKALTDKGTDNIQAYDAYLRGWQGYRTLTRAGFAEAKAYLEKAVELDPEFARAYAALAVLYWKAIQLAAPELREGLGLTSRRAKNAVRTKPHLLVKKSLQKPTALAHGLMSQFYLFRYQHDEALAEIEQAVAMDPNDPELYALMSHILWLIGKTNEAIESAKMGLRLDPNNPTTYLIQLAKAYLPDGNLDKGLQVLERAKRLNPELSGSIAATESIIFGIQGRIEEARAAYDIYLKSRQHPVRNLNDILLYLPFADPKKLDPIAEALIIAGAPGKATDYYRILSENRINGQEVKSLLFGSKITGTAMSTGKQFWWEWEKNGEFKIIGPFHDMGKSWVEGDVFFIQFKKVFGGLPYGTIIYRNPDGSEENRNQYFMVSDVGSITPFALSD
jgi:TolB-like protein/Tfp pilus assembly protein PilF